MRLKQELIKLSPEQRLYHLPVPIIGLTGGISTGKTTVSTILGQKGLYVINADTLVKEIYTWPETIQFIQSHFPEVMEEGKILFPILRKKVFSHPASKVLVERFIYQRLPAAFKKAYERLSSPQFVVYDVPLLFEKGLNQMVDVSTLVYIPRAIQKDRLIKRDKISSELAESILHQQMDIESKKTKSQFIIENTKSEQDLVKEVENFLHMILE